MATKTYNIVISNKFKDKLVETIKRDLTYVKVDESDYTILETIGIVTLRNIDTQKFEKVKSLPWIEHIAENKKMFAI